MTQASLFDGPPANTNPAPAQAQTPLFAPPKALIPHTTDTQTARTEKPENVTAPFVTGQTVKVGGEECRVRFATPDGDLVRLALEYQKDTPSSGPFWCIPVRRSMGEWWHRGKRVYAVARLDAPQKPVEIYTTCNREASRAERIKAAQSRLNGLEPNGPEYMAALGELLAAMREGS